MIFSSVTSYMPPSYDFAKMAMSGMGLSNAGKAPLPPGVPHNAPLMPDGEVDYEALLKMPH